ncbi:MAG TPA: STAS/SEC14 domain-containing protein [Solirubrobacteraceae bacterium]|nr:STAS/SEC14 domain-containing protein [Solirubrobacteraceae bacterium]
MLKRLAGFPAGTVGVEVVDELTAHDYADVLIPALEEAIGAAPDGKASVLYIAGPKTIGMTPGALWEDVKFGFTHLRDWKRIAIVSDADWYGHTLDAVGWLVPGEVRVFKNAELDDARAWIVD